MNLSSCWGRLCSAAIATLMFGSAALAQTGACCSGTTCTATTTGCATTNIFVLGGACTPNACGGACCSGTGGCTITASTGCSGTNTFLGIGTVCTPTTICNQYLGSCCTNLGVCTANVMAANCTGTSVFGGFGSTCATAPCVVVVGACCASNGSCTLVAATACAQPSTFTAAGTACGVSTCTIPTGACCAADGTCAVKNASGTGTGACGGTPGDAYQGDGTSCPGPCGALTGSCCTSAGACSIKTVSGCAAAGTTALPTTFAGVGTTCTTNPCVTGACCGVTSTTVGTLTCTVTTSAGCGLATTNFGTSSYLGNGTTCSPNSCFATLGSGACCSNGTNVCAVTIPSECVATSFATYQGNGTTCSPDPCSALRGACCGTSGSCTSTVFLGCFGLFRGVGSTCTPAPSPCFDVLGACCTPAGACTVASNAGGNGCTGANSFRGAGTSCFPTPCAALQGACCSGVGSCTVTIQSGCITPFTFVSAGSTCGSTPCNALKGACCSNIAACSITIASGCASPSVFSGAGTSCSPNNCTPTSGTCCNTDTGTCTQTTPAGCAGSSVVFNSGGSCNPGNPCTTVSGTCCIGFTCTPGTPASTCLAVGGAFFFQQSCTPTPCVRPTVDISQIFPGGGETGSPYKYDYVELFNRGATDVTMSNWSLQFGAQSTQTFPQRATFSGTILAGHYFLIQLASQDLTVGTDLPVPADVVSTSNVNLDVTGGRLALVSNSSPINSGCPIPIPVNIVDFVGYGPPSGTGSPSCSEGLSPTGARGGNIYAFFRKSGGCVDTDNNGADYITQPLTPNPHNSSATFACGTGSGACCTGETCAISTPGNCASAPAGYIGDGTSCTPSVNNPCLLARGSCCTGTVCAFTLQTECVSPSIYSFGRPCSPNPCQGACCSGTVCTFTGSTSCISPDYFQSGVACSPSPCRTPVVVQSGDIAYGASVAQNQDAIQQIRGAGLANPTRAGTWAKYNNLQIVRFDSRDGVNHNAQGNLLAMDFGTVSSGGQIFNMPTNGNATAGSLLFNFTDASTGSSGTNTFVLQRSRLSGMSVSPANNRIACIGYDFAKLYVMSYQPGATPGSGAGATLDGAVSTNNNDFVFGFNITQGTAWLDNDNVMMWVLSDIASVLKIYTVPVSGSGGTLALGTPVERLAVQDNKPNSSRFTSIAYNPQLIPGYVFLGASAFQSVSLNSLYIVDITGPTWQVVKAIDLSGSLQTERELAIGPDRNLYLCEFAGAGQTATDPLLDKITLDANGDGVVTAAEIAALTDNCSVDFYLKGQANTSSFNAIDIAISLGACCSGTSCSIQPPNFCNGAHGTYVGNNSSCSPNPCLAPSVCCRGATCTTAITTSAACSGTLIGGQTAGSTFLTGTCNTGGSTTTPCCYADYNKSGAISVGDIFDFLADWFAGSPYANTGGTGNAGLLSVQNIFDFLSAWFAGGC